MVAIRRIDCGCGNTIDASADVLISVNNGDMPLIAVTYNLTCEKCKRLYLVTMPMNIKNKVVSNG